eukprot:GHVQ01019864.1.p1 GENE.GHVQ01019864.1~~GHVQ01019864.1.p1  ORF type:complete len:1741 (+),score=301.52 GHVQ01019864.1:150-5372(+)
MYVHLLTQIYTHKHEHTHTHTHTHTHHHTYTHTPTHIHTHTHTQTHTQTHPMRQQRQLHTMGGGCRMSYGGCDSAVNEKLLKKKKSGGGVMRIMDNRVPVCRIVCVMCLVLLGCIVTTLGAPQDCTVLIYPDRAAEPSTMKDTSSTCPADGGVRAFVLDMKPDRTGHPVLKEASPTPSEQFRCAPDVPCQIAISGYGLGDGDSLIFFKAPSTTPDSPLLSSLCPVSASRTSEAFTVKSHRQIKTGSSAVFEHGALPLSDDTILSVFNLGTLSGGDGQRYVMCYASGLALRGEEAGVGDFRYYAGFVELSTDTEFMCDFDGEGTDDGRSNGRRKSVGEGLCGMIEYINNEDMDLRWARHSGKTETEGTGPAFDYSLGEGKDGYYMYMKSPGYLAGATATIMTQPSILSKGQHCVSLAYHMYGDDVNSLRVYTHPLKNDRAVTGEWGKPAWIRVGDQGEEWQRSGLNYESDGTTAVQFIFEALAGFSEKGDIGIDDVNVKRGKCEEELTLESYHQPYICGDVRMVSGSWSSDKSWFLEGAVSCAGRGYSYDDLKGGWQPCCVPSYGEYTVVLKDQFGDGWGGSVVEFKFFDEIFKFGEDFDVDEGREKQYKMSIGLLKIDRVEGSEGKIGLEVNVSLPQAKLWCGAATAGSPPPSVKILERYGIRSSEQTGINGGTIRMSIENGEGEVRMLMPNTDYDIYCYAVSPSAELGRDFLNTDNGTKRLAMDDAQVAQTRTLVTTDGTPPTITVRAVTPQLEGIVVDVNVDEKSDVFCIAIEDKGSSQSPAEVPGPSQMREKGVKNKIEGSGKVYVDKLMPDTTYSIYCYAEDMAKPKPNGTDKLAVQASHRSVMTLAKPPSLKIQSYKTFARGFSIFVDVGTPGNVWCGAAMAGSPYPSIADVKRVGATAEVTDISEPVELEIRGVPPNTRYTVYCFASSRSATREMTDADMWETGLEVSSFGKFCQLPTEPKTLAEGNPTPFDPITPTEEFLVRDYMMGRRELRLDGVYRITQYIDKEAVVNYLDNDAAFPPRYARVRVGTCQMGTGHYDQYKVGPLDSGRQDDLSYDKIADTVYTDCGGYTPQGVFGRRLMDAHHHKGLSEIMKESFGYWFGERPECANMADKLCLEFGPVVYEQIPIQQNKVENKEKDVSSSSSSSSASSPSHSRAWVGLRTPEGNHVPFYFVFNAPTIDLLNASNPTREDIKEYFTHHLQDVDSYWYDGTLYETLNELENAYKQMEVGEEEEEEGLVERKVNGEPTRKQKVTPVIMHKRRLMADKMRKDRQAEQDRVESRRLKSSKGKRSRRLAPTGPSPTGRAGLEYRIAPEHIEPQGKRFTIRSSPGVESYSISYAGWDFVINNDRDTSLRIWNLRFNDDRVAFETGLMEALAHYSVAERNWYFLDSWYGGLGAAARKIHKGVECPRTGETIFWDESVCVFEQDFARPLRSHWKSGELRDGAPHMALVVRQMLTVSNYDYITDWVFHLSGSWEGTVSFTGELYAGVEVPWFSSRQAHFGTQVTGSMRMGALHNHFAVWKVDFDVDGDHKDNSVYWKEVVSDPVRPGAHSVKDWFAEREIDAALRLNSTRPLHYFVVNEDHHVYGNLGGYFIQLRPSIAIPQPDFEVYSGPAAWTKYRIFSHVRKDGELDATLPRDNKYASRPATDVDRYIEDNEIIRHRDVVTWISDGIWHLPHIEDMPLTVAIGNTLGWLVKPSNFYTEDPSMDLHNAIAGDIKDPGTCAVIRQELSIL